MEDELFSKGFYELPHTADVSLAVAGPTLEDLFINAARGMQHLMGISHKKDTVNIIHINLVEHDLETLLISFLTELLYLIEQKLMVKDMRLKIEDAALYAQLETLPMAESQMEIKAVTFNNLNIDHRGNIFTTQIVFDI